jgi:hypothetical protein
MCDAWKKLVGREREELRSKTTNTTKNLYVKSGVNSFDPYFEGWTTAIETTGRV